ncbi:hypothetical protein [Corynebacterium pacaense]|uniref:hypothetical protein n=1 Tax=Corynebacterium pacaense TaxID=1816684 RepID=UPI0009BA51F8|nr:hypothetical protein [Corynebacterium pacaense]
MNGTDTPAVPAATLRPILYPAPRGSHGGASVEAVVHRFLNGQIDHFQMVEELLEWALPDSSGTEMKKTPGECRVLNHRGGEGGAT